MVVKVFYSGRKHRTEATGEYDTDTGELTVFEGSVVSESIAKFSRTENIKDLRRQHTDDKGVLLHNLTFDSPSAAAVFVSGYSANGLIVWHVERHKTLKSLLQENE